MEFDIDINLLLRDVITKVDSRLQVCRCPDISFADARKQLFDIVSKMGEASAKAQGLAGTITTGRRVETSDHHLYIMKDSEGSRGKGAVIGILKVGRKRLFVYDHHGQQWEMNPLCVLDFYVHESRQRMGCGRRLFDFMLKSENMAPQHLAVDRPSLKFSSFLAKHYGLRTEIPQVNNFVIFQGFFTSRSTDDFIHNRRNTNGNQPVDFPSKENRNSDPASYNYSTTSRGHPHDHHPHPHPAWASLSSSRTPTSPHIITQPAGLPSTLARQGSVAFQQQQQNALKDLNLNPRPAQSMMQSRNSSPKGLTDLDLRSMSDGSGSNSGNMKNRNSNLQLQSAMYSRHQMIKPSAPHQDYSSAQRPPSSQLNAYNASSNSSNGKDSTQSSNNKILPPSTSFKRENSPPMLPRDGPPQDYLESFNLHKNYQGRAGHLVVNSQARIEPSAPVMPSGPSPDKGMPANPSAGSPPAPLGHTTVQTAQSQLGARGGYYTNPALHPDSTSSWTVFGVLRRHNNQFSATHSGRTRLW